MKILLLSFLFNFFVISTSYATDILKISNPWIPEAPPGAAVMAGYMEINNLSDQPVDIIQINSSAFNSVEMHLSKETDGFAKMLPQKKLTIPASGKLTLKPGSYHLMLIKPVKRLLNGEKVSLSLSLSNGDKISIDATVKKNKTRSMKCAAGKCGGM